MPKKPIAAEPLAAKPVKTRSPRTVRNTPEENRMATALCNTVRWKILKELAKGQALPTVELKRRIKTTNLTQHLAILIKTGWIEKKFSTLYGLTENVRVDAEAGHLDLGPFILKLDPPAK